MNENDVWIEVSQLNPKLHEFYSELITESRPVFPGSLHSHNVLVSKFNLTAYVRHMAH